MNDFPSGFFGQELKVGDPICWAASSSSSKYIRVGVITKIEETQRWNKKYWNLFVKIYNPRAEIWTYNFKTETINKKIGEKTYIRQIFNYQTAITLNETCGELKTIIESRLPK